MKKLLLILLLSSSSILHANEWRTPHTTKNIEAIRKSGANLDGDLVGLTGNVGKVSAGYMGKPIFQLVVSDDWGKETVVIGALLNAALNEGDVIEVFGDVVPLQDKDEKAKRLTQDRFMIPGLCIVNQTKGYAMGAEPAKDLCKKWYLKEFPKRY